MRAASVVKVKFNPYPRMLERTSDAGHQIQAVAFLTVGIGLHLWLSLLLCCFFWLPGIIHALRLVVRKAEVA